MLDNEIREVASAIGQFYLQKNSGDYQAAEKEIHSLLISKIEVTHNSVSVTTGRPGLLIGRMGRNVDALSKFLKKEVRVIEDMDPLAYYLIPRFPDEHLDL